MDGQEEINDVYSDILRAGHSFRFWENAIVLENHYVARC